MLRQMVYPQAGIDTAYLRIASCALCKKQCVDLSLPPWLALGLCSCALQVFLIVSPNSTIAIQSYLL